MMKFNMFITLLVLPFYWIKSQYLRRFGSKFQIQKEMKRYSKHYLGFRRIKVEIHGFKEDKDQNYIFICNHQSHNDIFVCLAAISQSFRFIAKKELFENFVTGTFMKMSQSYPLDRDDARESLTLLKKAVADVNNGVSVLAFPEGTRSYQKDLLEFKDGMFSVLRRAKAPMVFMYIKESYNEKQHVIHVYFSKLFPADKYNHLKGNVLSQYAFEEMNRLKVQAYAKL